MLRHSVYLLARPKVLLLTGTHAMQGAGSLEVLVNVCPSECFLFSGYRHVQLRVLPGSKTRIELLMVPLVVGRLVLPFVQIRSHLPLFVS